MNTNKTLPTPATYNQLQAAYDWFNIHLFNKSLPNCLITLQRKSNAMGYFSAQRWANAKGEKTDEISLNPAYFANHSVKELLQTLVHEMCHQWQQHFGKPSRNGYHNKQWADKMESVGLMPSSSGDPGGARTGQHMGDFAIPDGAFETQVLRLFNNEFALPWVDRFIAFTPTSQDRAKQFQQSADNKILQMLERPIVELMPELDVICEDNPKIKQHKQKRKTTYRCPKCNSKVWGKPMLALACLDCDAVYQVV